MQNNLYKELKVGVFQLGRFGFGFQFGYLLVG